MDRRTKYTQKVIKETFINLLEQKELTKITVSEICEIADINRATFYRYYLDVYDLLSKIQKEIEEELRNSYHPKSETDNTVSKALLEVMLKNKKLVKVLFDTNDNIFFLNTILEVAYEKCKEKWKSDLPELSDEDIEYASVFIFNGALGVVNFWVKNDFDKDIDEISNIIESISYYGTRRFIYKK